MTAKELIDLRSPFQVPVQESEFMAGMKKAVWDGHVLYVSPAMMSLFKDDCFEMVLGAVEIIAIPRFKPW